MCGERSARDLGSRPGQDGDRWRGPSGCLASATQQQTAIARDEQRPFDSDLLARKYRGAQAGQELVAEPGHVRIKRSCAHSAGSSRANQRTSFASRGSASIRMFRSAANTNQNDTSV
jgi:hypothetical protein